MRKNGKNEKVKKENGKCQGKKDWKKLRAFFAETFSGFTKMEISSGKRLKSRWEKIRKSGFAPPPEKFPCYAPASLFLICFCCQYNEFIE